MNITRENETFPFIGRVQEEWQGSRPFKRKGNKKVIRPIDNNPLDRNYLNNYI